mmetsp:Transcript_50990/g.163164  ORF Transcript_50990/g.163164 Transcript_50990/m.163164 type:complete len:327 (-) Transcript_50990:675-1655(-)
MPLGCIWPPIATEPIAPQPPLCAIPRICPPPMSIRIPIDPELAIPMEVMGWPCGPPFRSAWSDMRLTSDAGAEARSLSLMLNPLMSPWSCSRPTSSLSAWWSASRILACSSAHDSRCRSWRFSWCRPWFSSCRDCTCEESLDASSWRAVTRCSSSEMYRSLRSLERAADWRLARIRLARLGSTTSSLFCASSAALLMPFLLPPAPPPSSASSSSSVAMMPSRVRSSASVLAARLRSSFPFLAPAAGVLGSVDLLFLARSFFVPAAGPTLRLSSARWDDSQASESPSSCVSAAEKFGGCRPSWERIPISPPSRAKRPLLPPSRPAGP